MQDTASGADSNSLLPVGRESAALPALVEEAERALSLVSNAVDAELLWRKISAVEHAARLAKTHGDMQLIVGRLKLRAERRWGELLPPPESPAEAGRKGGQAVSNGNGLPVADRVAQHKARQVADVPEPIFEKYVTGVRDGEKLRRARLLRLQRESEAERRRKEPIEPSVTVGGAEIRHGDLRTALADLHGQVDAIITDPPYPAEFIEEFDALGRLAAELLKPTGILVAMVGQAHLPAYLERLGRHLTYRWCGAYLTNGPATRIHGRKVGTKWKPLLIFGGEDFITQDVFASRADDKRHHHWGQSESGMADIVERLTNRGALVVDPFVGGGTTAVVCETLGRRFVGCDADADAVRTTRERLAA